MQYVPGTERSLLIYYLARALLADHAHRPLYFLQQQIPCLWGISAGFNRKKNFFLKLNCYCYDQKFCALSRCSLTCVQRLSYSVCLLVHITNSANCSNYMKKSLMAREVIMLFPNRLPSTAFINYASLQIRDQQIIHLRLHTICTATLSKLLSVSVLACSHCIATICNSLSPALLILKIESKVRIESGCKCDLHGWDRLEPPGTTLSYSASHETHPECLDPEPFTATQELKFSTLLQRRETVMMMEAVHNDKSLVLLFIGFLISLSLPPSHYFFFDMHSQHQMTLFHLLNVQAMTKTSLNVSRVQVGQVSLVLLALFFHLQKPVHTYM